MKKLLLVVLFSIGTLGIAHAQYNPNYYHQGLQQQNVLLGRVISVRPAQGRGGHTMGNVVGGIAGAALGHQAGRGIGKTLATAAGALMGAFAGGRVQQSVTSHQAMLVTVRLQTGRAIAVVESGTHFRLGQKVQVLYGRGHVRVLPL